MKLNEKPKQIEAEQFTGGLDSARNLIEWLYARGITTGSYVPEVLDDGEVVLEENVFVHGVARHGIGGGVRIRKGNWAVLDPAHDLYAARTEDIFEKYEEAKE